MLEFPAFTSLCAWFVSTLPVQHAAISTLGEPFELSMVDASDEVATELEHTQLDLGVGPCWQAKASGVPVLVHDLRQGSELSWPALLTAAESHGVRSTYAFPMAVGAIDVGVVDLYSTTTHALTSNEVQNAWAMADVAAVRVVDQVLSELSTPPPQERSPKRSLHQATGMVMAQLGVPSDDALVVIRAHAFATGTSIPDVAEAIIRRDIDFSA
ncbi:hypothetical protein CH252_20830 [Rhodococcus sp. 06-1477-1B]|nr:hypothetical protein CH252_20830 [Rhodococcus sp. 06-1477-1B]